MKRFRLSAAWLALALVCTTATSCDHTPAPTEPTLAPSMGKVPKPPATYTLVREGSLLSPLTVSGVISTVGGTLNLAGHTLTVPRGAVSVPTLFTMTVPLTGYIEVDLRATVTNTLGQIIDVGELGFKKPVTLTLTYSRSPDNPNPTKLLIVYVNGSQLQPLSSSVNGTAKTVTTTLPHFSRYAMATN